MEIKQWDPLSPIPFDMAMDILSYLIEREVKERKIDTYQMNEATFITHLMYAEDVLIFSKAKPKSLKDPLSPS